MTLRAAGFTPVPPGVKPGFDHADTHLGPNAASRVYVAHTGADRVDAQGCASGAYLRVLPDLPGVAGVLVDSARDLRSPRIVRPRDSASSARQMKCCSRA